MQSCRPYSLYYESGEVLKQASQGDCGCLFPGGVQGQVGWGPGQPGLVLHGEVGGPACGRRVGDSSSLRSLTNLEYIISFEGFSSVPLTSVSNMQHAF